MIDFIAPVSLIWLIYTFLFVESDKKLSELFERLRFSRSVNKSGAVDIKQLQANQAIGITELFELEKKIKNQSVAAKNIGRFRNKHTHINKWKNWLIVNLFILTLNTLLLELFISNSCWLLISKIYLLASLTIVAFFYKETSKIENVKFVNFVV